MSQSGLALAIGVSLRTVQLYEKKDANIPIKNLTKIADFFNIGIGELYLNEVREPGAAYSKKPLFSNKVNMAYLLANGRTLIRVPLVLVESQKEFIDNYNNEIFIGGLSQMDFLVHTIEDTSFVAFEILGDSMNDSTSNSIPNGALVLGKKIDKKNLFDNKKLLNQSFIILCKDRIICKSITDSSRDKATLTCHNLNPSPEFRDFEIPIKDVLGIYKVIKKQF